MATPSLDEIRGDAALTLDSIRQAAPSAPAPTGDLTLESLRQIDAPRLPAAERAGGSRGGTLARGVDRGLKVTTGGTAGHFVTALGDATGLGSLVEFGDELVEEALVEAFANPAEIHGLEDIRSLGDVSTFIAQTVGEQLPNLALAVTGATSGAGLAGFIARRGIAKRTSQEVAKRAARRGLIRTPKIRGAEAGAFASFFPINTGEILQELNDVGFDPDLGPVAVLGAGSTALEVLGFEVALRAIFRNFEPEVAAHTIGQVLQRIGVTSLQGLSAEGGTEAVQEALVIASRKLEDPTFSITDALTTSENLSRITFAGVSGATVGGILGGAGGTVTSVAGAGKAAAQSSRVNRSVTRASEALSEMFANRRQGRAPEDVETASEEVVEGLFDVEGAQRDFTQFVGRARTAFVTALAAVREGLSTTDQTAAKTAAEERLRETERHIQQEFNSLDMAGEELESEAGFVGQAIAEVRRALNSIQSVPEKTARQNEATRATVEELKASIEELKSIADVRERAAKAQELLKKTSEAVKKGLFDPTIVPKQVVRQALTTIEKAFQAGLKNRRQAFKSYRQVLERFDKQVKTLNRRLSGTNVAQETTQETVNESDVAQRPQEQEGTTTPIKRILSSITDVANGVAPVAQAVGYTVSTLPQVVKTQLGKLGLRPRQEPGRVVFHRRGEEDIDGDASFGTPIDQIPPEQAVTVTAVKAGGERDVEVVDKRDPVSVREAIQRRQAIAGEGGTVEVGSLDEEVTQQVREIIDETREHPKNKIKEATDAISQAYRSITLYLAQNPDKNILTIPGDHLIYKDKKGRLVTWSDFMDAAPNAEYLVSQFMDLQQFWADPDAFVETHNPAEISSVQDLQDMIEAIHDGAVDPEFLFNTISALEEQGSEFFMLSGNHQPVLVSIEEEEGGVLSYSRVDGKPAAVRFYKSEEAILDALLNPRALLVKKFGDRLPKLTKQERELLNEKLKQAETVEESVRLKREALKGKTDLTAFEFGEGQWMLSLIFQDGQVVQYNRQVVHALKRGNDTAKGGKENKFILPVTIVHKRDDKDNPTKVTHDWIHLGEVTELGSMVNRSDKSVIGKLGNAHVNFYSGLAKLAEAYDIHVEFSPLTNEKDQDKVIYGRVTHKKSARFQKSMGRILHIAETAGYPTAIEELAVMLADPKQGGISWNDVSEFILSQAKEERLLGLADVTTRKTQPEGKVTLDLDEQEVTIDSSNVDPAMQRLKSALNKWAEAGKVRPLGKEEIHFVLQSYGAIMENEWGAVSLEREYEESQLSGVLVAQRTRQLDEVIVDPSVPYARPDIVRKREKGEVGEQVTNLIRLPNKRIWQNATDAVNFVVRMLNIKENLVLFDQDSATDLVARLTEERMWHAQRDHDEVVKDLDQQIDLIKNTIESPPNGRIIPSTTYTGTTFIFVNKFPRKAPALGRKPSRNLILMHEIGHLIQFTHLMQLSPKLQKKVLKNLALGKTVNDKYEAFANWMAKVAADKFLLEEGTSLPTDPLMRFFARVVRDLKQAWTHLAVKLNTHRYYPGGFRDFVAALNSHAKVEKGLPIDTKKLTPLGKQIFDELQALESTAYIPALGFRALDMSVDTAESTAERSQSSVFKNYVEDFQDFVQRMKDSPADAVKSLVYTTDGELRAMGLDWLADKFHVRPGTEGNPLTVFREIRQEAAPFFKHLSRILPEIPGGDATFRFFKRGPDRTANNDRALRARIMDGLMRVDEQGNHLPLNQLDPEIRPHVTKIRAYLARMHSWYTSQGIPLGKKQNFYPLMLDGYKVEHNRELFIDLIMQYGNGITREEAENFRQRIVVDSDGGLNNSYNREANTTAEFFGPGFASTRRRARFDSKWTPALRNALVEAGFYQEDLTTTLIAYTEMAVRRAVWQKRFGFREGEISAADATQLNEMGINPHSPVAKLQRDIRQANLNDWQRGRVLRDLLPAYAGQLGLRTNYHVRRLSSWAVIYQNLRILSFAVLSSIVDVGTLIARTPLSDIHIHGNTFSQFASKQGREDLFNMLEDIGAMRQSLTEHILNDQALNTFMTGRAKQINDLFFKYNGMEGWTNMMRALALGSGRQFLIRHAEKAQAGNQKSQRYLRELGIEAGVIRAWDGHSTTADPQINAALNRFIDESMIRPDPSIRPTWMSDPSYGVFAHLKGFMYGFHETFLRRALNEVILHQNLLPFLMLGMMALPFAAVGYEIRRYITGAQNRPQGSDYMQEVVERSGLLGAFQFIVDMEQADDFGKPYGLGIAGPSVEQLYDFWTKDMESFVPRSIPIVAQFPQAREWVKDAL